ncbi:MAG: chromosomal replication initiator protein DnaA [Acidimicrobiales bacterium]
MRTAPHVADAVWMSTFQGAVAIAFEADTLVLGVPSPFVRDRVIGPYRTLVADALRSSCGREIAVSVEVHTPAAVVAPAADPLDALLGTETGRVHTSGRSDAAALPGAASRPLPVYTFEAFVTGPSNRFAQAAALAVAETPGRSYNPLFIYGDAGLGKTHLLQAIAHYVGENYPDKVVRYVSSEKFLNEFVESIRNQTGNEFQKRWREVDVLLVDDIQFIERAERFQEEFFHTFNELHDRRSQIVLTSDRAPDAIATLEKRLRSRFMMGLITDIQPPDVETRIAILRKKAEKAPAAVPDAVLDFIAENITDNIRELEGALTRVTAYANLYDVVLDVPLAERTLSDILGERQPRPITAEAILVKTSERFNFSVEDLQGKSRRRPLVTARQVAMYVVRELTDLSYPAIAREFGGRDHTTVIHAVDKIGKLMQERKQIFHQVQALIQDLRKA